MQGVFKLAAPTAVGISKRVPMIKNPTAATSCSRSWDISAAIDPPAILPMKLANTKAKADPRKTASGRLEVPESAIVASCVLSPSSARKTVVNVDRNSGRSTD